MNAKPDGGPAFPKDGLSTASGMSLRDWMAGQALANMVQRADLTHSLHNADVCRNLAKSCYCLADAMLAAREKGTQ